MKSRSGESKRKGIFTFCKLLTIPVKFVFTIDYSGGRGVLPRGGAEAADAPSPAGRTAKCRVNDMVK